MFKASASNISHDSNHWTRLADCTGCEVQAEVLEWNRRPLIVRAWLTMKSAAARNVRDRRERRAFGNPPF